MTTAAAPSSHKFLGVDRLHFALALPSIDLRYVVPVLVLLLIANRAVVFLHKLRVRVFPMLDGRR